MIAVIRDAAVRRAAEIITFRSLDIDHFRGDDGTFSVTHAQLDSSIPAEVQEKVFELLLKDAVAKMEPMARAFCNTYDVSEDDLTMTTDENGKRHFVKNVKSAFVIAQLDTIGLKHREEQILVAYYADVIPDEAASPIIAASTCLVYDALHPATP